MEDDALKLCRALGYDFNSVEFAVQGSVPYAIDFLNAVPDADVHSVGEANFDWVVKQLAELAIAKARTAPRILELNGLALLGGAMHTAARAKRKAGSSLPIH
jgi:hypothetical protein